MAVIKNFALTFLSALIVVGITTLLHISLYYKDSPVPLAITGSVIVIPLAISSLVAIFTVVGSNSLFMQASKVFLFSVLIIVMYGYVMWKIAQVQPSISIDLIVLPNDTFLDYMFYECFTLAVSIAVIFIVLNVLVLFLSHK
jgi:hypothetical protein